jgi:aminoglycoside phosphotransferase (APT) family kinase protein
VTTERLPHGYTNRTRRAEDGSVEKRYDGPRAWENAMRELTCLEALRGRLPVPDVLRSDLEEPMIAVSYLEGRHGQDLIDEGHASAILASVGRALVDMQSIPTETIDLQGAGSVIVHGDFGPQNMLFDPTEMRVTAIVDWESAHIGSPVEDLAWAEWIVRMHHPRAVGSLGVLFAAARLEPPWAERHRAMLDQCESILRYCRTAGFERPGAEWERRLARTSAWTEDPTRDAR